MMSDLSNTNGGASSSVKMVPVRNLWLLMLYASDLYRENGDDFFDVEKDPDKIPDLTARILCRRVEERLLARLCTGYVRREGELSRVRGRIDFLRTERHFLLSRGRVACRYEELSVNTPRNRFVKTALERAAEMVSESQLAHRCRGLVCALRQLGITGGCPRPMEGEVAQFGLYDRQDRPMVDAARLIFELAIPTESTGTRRLSVPARNIHWLRKLYEKAVAGFYDVALAETEWSVTVGRWFQWQTESLTGRVEAILPEMKTDVILENRRLMRRIVIDTKFNELLVKGWHRERTLRSGYLYQIYAYLLSQEGLPGDCFADGASGVLLHPSAGEDFDESVRIQCHEIRFKTVNLAGSAEVMRKNLLEVLEPSEVDVRE